MTLGFENCGQIVVYSLLWGMQGLCHQPYEASIPSDQFPRVCCGCSALLWRSSGTQTVAALHFSGVLREPKPWLLCTPLAFFETLNPKP